MQIKMKGKNKEKNTEKNEGKKYKKMLQIKTCYLYQGGKIEIEG